MSAQEKITGFDKENFDSVAAFLQTCYDSLNDAFSDCEKSRNRRLATIEFEKTYYFNVLEDAKRQDPKIVLESLLIKIPHLKARVSPNLKKQLKNQPAQLLEIYLEEFLIYLVEKIEGRLNRDLRSIGDLRLSLSLLQEEYAEHLDKRQASTLMKKITKIQTRIDTNNKLDELNDTHSEILTLLYQKERDPDKFRKAVEDGRKVILDKQPNLYSSNMKALQRELENYTKMIAHNEAHA